MREKHEVLDCLVTIITVCRNDKKRLTQTIGSLSAFYGDMRYEHIVVDGLSNDGTYESVSFLQAVRNFHFISKQDNGIYDAMNRGIRSGLSGRYVLFLNCGDCMIVEPDELASHIIDMEDQNIIPDIICFAFRQEGLGGAFQYKKPLSDVLHKMPTSHQAMLFSEQFLKLNTYNTAYKIAADYDLFLRASQEKKQILLSIIAITSTEIDGFASMNPRASYMEYLQIAYNNLEGWTRALAFFRILIRAFGVVSLKSVFPHFIVKKMRGIL